MLKALLVRIVLTSPMCQKRRQRSPLILAVFLLGSAPHLQQEGVGAPSHHKSVEAWGPETVVNWERTGSAHKHSESLANA